jgi:hypothetical protein
VSDPYLPNEEWETVEIKEGPRDPGRWVAVIVEIRENATGNVRIYHDNAWLEDRDHEPSTFIWDDGNYACDCNRATFFAEAVGEPDPDRECGDGAFAVRLRNKVNNRIFYDEFGNA